MPRLKVDGVSATETATAGLAVGAASSSQYAAVTTATSISVSTAAVTAGGFVAAGASAYAISAETSHSAAGTVSQQEYIQSVPVTDPLWEGAVDGLEITLPSGAVYEHLEHPPDRHTTNNVRGFGMAYIMETTSITQSEIENVLENAEEAEIIKEDGEVRYIIGNGISGEEKIILSIIGGTVATASTSSVYNEDCGATITIDRGDNPQHSLRDGKAIDEVTTLTEILKNPTRIVDAGHKRYYILKLGTNRVLMVSTRIIDETYQILMTSLTGDGPNNAFRTIDDAMNEIERNHGDDYEIVHDPENGIEC